MSGLVVDGVTVAYGDTAALDRFDLVVTSGEIMAVLGPSGSGKSTLLRAVAGLEPLTTGRITLGGRDLAGVPTHHRELGMMFQDHGLFTHLSVGRNIGYGLRVAGAGRAAERARVSELLALVGLEGFADRAPNQLSGGEAQRVALARALAPEPGLLMLDEPLGSLDRALRDQLTGDLRRMLTEIGQTALHVTHDQAEAFAIADRVAVVSAGRPVAVGAPADLWAEPGTEFVARFLGHPNVWSVTVDGQGTVAAGETLLGRVADDHPLLADDRSGATTTQGRRTRRVVVPATALRPVSADPDAGDALPSFAALVTASVFRQGLYEVTVEPEDDRNGGRGRVTAVIGDPVTVGAPIRLAVDCSQLTPLTGAAT
ncbi:MAG: ABC transporter ATP-binding protein [Actinomycetota bacterium]